MSKMRDLLNILNEAGDPSYPEGIHQYDDVPGSPFYKDAPEVDLEATGYIKGEDLSYHLLMTDYNGNKVSQETTAIRCKAIVRANFISQNGPITKDDKKYKELVDVLKNPYNAAKEILSTNYKNISDVVFPVNAVETMEKAIEKMVHSLTSNNDVDLEYNYYELDGELDSGEPLDRVESKLNSAI